MKEISPPLTGTISPNTVSLSVTRQNNVNFHLFSYDDIHQGILHSTYVDKCIV